MKRPTITVRMDPADLQFYERMAEENGLTLSELVRASMYVGASSACSMMRTAHDPDAVRRLQQQTGQLGDDVDDLALLTLPPIHGVLFRFNVALLNAAADLERKLRDPDGQ